MSKAPAVRFKGFTDPWEQRKFSDFVIASGVKNRDNLPLQSYSVSNDRGFVPQDEQFENGGTMRDADKSMYWIVEPGSFAYNPARINVGSIGYLSTSDNVIVSSLYEVFRADESCDERFLWHWFKSPLFMKQIEMLQEGGVRLYFFFDKLLLSEIWMPCVEEQRLIGAHFDRLDNLITLHQRKHEQLTVLKKALLDKMFPKDGACVPEIRFSGFTDPWEQRKFSEAIVISTDMVDPKTGEFDNLIHIGPGDMEPYTGQLSSDIKTVAESELISGKFHFYPGDVIYSKIRPELSKCVIAPAEGLASADAYVLRGKKSICQEFLYTLLHTDHFYGYATAVSMRTGMPKVNRDELSSYSFYAPSIQEQREISSAMLGLDNLITLHQRKLEVLRNLKSALLEKMFV